jgi:biotin synthase-related radical SAM superfamily protein
VQLEPVERKYVEQLKDAGADTIGIHIETLDEYLFKKVCPGKDFNLFENAWKDAVDIYGENQVSSYVLVGMGEDHHATLSGIEKMVQMGVIPYVVPFRPLSGTVSEKWSLPPLKTVKTYARHAARTMKMHGINPFKNKAGCVRCGACSPVKDYLRTI